MLPPGFFAENIALPVVPSALIPCIHAKTELSDACMGLCQVCRTNHFFRRGKCTSEKGIGHLLGKSIQGYLVKDPQLHQINKETNIFFSNASAKCVFPYQLFIEVQNLSAPVYIVFSHLMVVQSLLFDVI